MRAQLTTVLFLAVALLCAACPGSGPQAPDAGPGLDASLPRPDASAPRDAGGPDTGPIDLERPAWPLPTSPQTNYAGDDDTVSDGVTGLVWQRGTSFTTYRFEQAVQYCQDLTLAGGGWRLPTWIELVSLVDLTQETFPFINKTAFPDTKGAHYWSSTPWPSNDSWAVDFGNGALGPFSLDSEFWIRCVRGTPAGPVPVPRFTATSDTVHDNVTGLTWQRAVPGTFDLASAKASCEKLDLGGSSTGWRLPTQLELASIVEIQRPGPPVDPELFPSTPLYDFWTSSPCPSKAADEGMVVVFLNGSSSCHNGPGKSGVYYRCVR